MYWITPSRLIVVLNSVEFRTFSTVYSGPGKLIIELKRHFSKATSKAGPSSCAPPSGCSRWKRLTNGYQPMPENDTDMNGATAFPVFDLVFSLLFSNAMVPVRRRARQFIGR